MQQQQQKQVKMQQLASKRAVDNLKLNKGLAKLQLLLVLAIILAMAATVAAVPISVLGQNSELASTKNTNNKNILRSDMNILRKVKRASNIVKNSTPTSTAAISSSSLQPASGAALNKKSSPEIVPASFNAPPVQSKPQLDVASQSSSVPSNGAGILLPANGEIINSAIAAGLTAAVEAAANQREWDQQQQQLYGGNTDTDDLYEETPTLLHKRGISSQQYLYGGAAGNTAGYGVNSPSYNNNNDFYNNNPFLGLSAPSASQSLPNGVWSDELDPTIVYTDMQDLDDYAAPAPRVNSYRNKAYDNLQNLLNAEAYLEPVVLPYSNRYYTTTGNVADADHNKRSNFNKYNNKYINDLRLKRDTKLTPADMLALVALVEAGERARKDTDADAGYMYPAENYSPKSYNNAPANGGYASIDYPSAVDDVDYNAGGTWLEPNVVDYYGVPVNVETIPKYELAREHKYGGGVPAGAGMGGGRYSGKRFMVAKKKRSSGKFLNEPVAKPSFNYNLNAEKYF